ncbi:MAG: aminotransferase class I/II-fold pyridoxal phosphate-dependent enzyme [Pirellulales bacterium]|nr:aminotransferase class I/II-fold pyridoxal phosphate-dependent enzyme [Pirellulales bacterium]
MSESLEQLQLSPQAMRDFGNQVVELLVQRFVDIDSSLVTQIRDPAELTDSLQSPFPDEPQDLEQLLAEVSDTVFGQFGQTMHPRFFAFVPSPNNFVSVMAEALVAGFNAFAGNWLEASGPTQMELATLQWLRRQCGLPQQAGGIFTSGGSVANLTALAAARDAQLAGELQNAVAYCSDQTHRAVDRAFHLLGFKPRQLVRIPSDAHQRLPIEALQSRFAADVERGLRPFCVIANAGTTNTGAVDPLPELADFCRKNKTWLHADGAYGAAAVLTQEGRDLLPGLSEVDSLVIDPHKWLFQPYELGCVLVRDRRDLYRTFKMTGEYLQDVETIPDAINLYDFGPQMTRSAKALKLWLSLRAFGVSAFRSAIQRGMDAARYAEGEVRSMDRMELVTSAQLAVVTFRYAPCGDGQLAEEANRAVVHRGLTDGFATVTSTVLGGNSVLRLCTINPRTTNDDVRSTLERLRAFGDEFVANK